MKAFFPLLKAILAAVLLPASASAYTFTGDFSQSGGAHFDGNGNEDRWYGVAVDTFTGGGPYVYSVGVSSQGVSRWDWAVVKYDKDGVMLASATLDVARGANDAAESVLLDAAGNVYVAGALNGLGAVAKFDSSLALTTSVTNGAGVLRDLAWDGAGALWAVGNLAIVKFSTGLVLQSSTSFVGGGDEVLHAVVSSGGYVYAAGSTGTAASDMLLLKYDTSLVYVGSVTFNSEFAQFDGASDLAMDGYGSLYLGGRCGDADDDPRFCVVKSSPSLVIMSSATHGVDTQTFEIEGLLVDNNEIYAIGPGNNDLFLVRYSTDLVVQSSKTVNIGDTFESPYAVARGTGNYVYASGWWKTGSYADGRTLRYTMPDFVGGSPAPTAAVSWPSAAFVSLSSAAGVANAFGGNTVSTVSIAARQLSDGLYWNGGSFASSVPFYSTAVFSGSSSGTWTFSQGAFFAVLAGGTSYQIHARVDDSAAQQGFSSTRTFTYDVSGPTVAITFPLPSSTLASLTAISGTSTDTVSGVSLIEVRLSSGPGFSADWTGSVWSTASVHYIAAAGSTASWNAASLPGTSDLVAGTTYQAQARGTDAAGNQTVAVSTFLYEGPPVTSLTFSNVTGSSLRANWSSGYASFTAYISTGFMPNSFAGNASSSTANMFAVFSGLATNTTYWVRISTQGGSDFSDQLSTRTAVYDLPSGCGAGLNVKKDGTADHLTIQAAVNALPQSLAADTCVVLRDSATYAESVTVQGFANNGYQLRIMADPSLAPARPTLMAPSGSSEGFLIANASVSITALNLVSTTSLAYGVKASSAYLTLSSMTISAAGSVISGAGVFLSSWSTVSRSSISVGVAHGVQITGGGNLVFSSTMADNASGYFALYVQAASSNTVTQSHVSNPTGVSAYVTGGSDVNTISLSSITTATGFAALEVHGASNAIVQCHVSNPAGHAAILGSAGIYNSVVRSTVTSGSSTAYALHVSLSSASTVSQNLVVNAGGMGLRLSGSTSSVVGHNSISGSSGSVALGLDSGNGGAIVLLGNTLTGAGKGVELSTQAAGAVLSLANVSFQSLAAGATAISFLGGTFVSTVSGGSFDASAVVNVDGSGLSAASRVTMVSASGVRAGPAYELDPLSVVDWPGMGVPTVAVTSPSSAALSGLGLITGTADTTGATVSTVAVAVRRVSDGLYWIMGSFGSAVPAYTTAAFTGSSSGTWAWTQGQPFSADLTNGTSYHVHAKIQDSGLVEAFSSTRTFTYDVSAPTIAVNQPVPGAAAVSFLSITGTASDSAAGISTVAVRLSSAPSYGTYWSSASWGASPLFLTASGTAAWSYASLPSGADLAAGTTYQIEARATDGAGNNTVSVSTFLYSPPTLGPLPFSNVNDTALTANWSSAFSSFTAQLSTGAFPNSFAGNQSSATSNQFATFSGLTPNTTYYAQVSTAGASVFSDLGSTITLTAPPVITGFGSLGSSSMSISWSSGTNPSWTQYQAQLSSDGFATSVSSLTLGAAAVWTSLTPHTTYFARVRSINAAGTAGGFVTTAGGVMTEPVAPTTAALSGVTSAQAVVNWGTNGNSTFTAYEARLSTDSFASWQTVVAVGSAAVFSSLPPNTGLSARVRATSLYGTFTAFVDMPSSSTLLAQPSTAALSIVYAASSAVSVQWTTGGNPNGTVYVAEASTDSFATLSGSSQTLGLSAAFSALQSNATYYLRVRASSGSSVSPDRSLGSTITLAAVPQSPAALVGLSTVTLSWSDAVNASGTQYLAELSTSPGFVTSLASATAGLSAQFTGLASNTTYYGRVAAYHKAGGQTAWAAAADTATLTAPPVSPALSGVSSSALTASWGANGNSTFTVYEVRLSSDAFASYISALTTATSAAFTGLNPNSGFEGRVRGLGLAGASAFVYIPATSTVLVQPAAASPAFVSVQVASVSVQWASGGNPPGTVYIAEASSNSFASVLASSSTANLSAVFGSGGAGTLGPNATYYFRVRASSAGAASADLVLGSTHTLAYAPTASAVLTVTSHSVVLSWSENGNPEPGTLYEYWRDTSAGFPSPVIVSVSTSGALAEGLAASTTYYFKARAVNLSNVPSAFDAVVSTLTRAPLAPAPGTPVGAALGVSTISWSWTVPADAVTFTVYATSDTVNPIAVTTVPVFIHQGLNPNTQYSIRVAGNNASGQGTLSPTGAAYTLANPPGSLSASGVQVSSLTLSWTLNGNPAGLTSELERSLDGAGFSQIAVTASTSAVDSGLTACTTYYYRVRFKNGAAVATAYASTQVRTQDASPSPPGGLAAEPLAGNRILLGWSPSATAGVSSYRLYYDAGTGAVSYASPLAVFGSSVTAYTTGVLASSAAYKFALRSVSQCGSEDSVGAQASAPSLTALGALRAAIKIPESGKRIAGNMAMVMAEIVTGAIADASEVRFQIRASSGGAWTDITPANANFANPNPSAPYFIHLNAEALAAGSYELRAVAKHINGSVDEAPGAITVVIDPANFDSKETVTGSSMKKEQKVSNAVNNVIQAGAVDSDATARVDLPAGALASSTVTLTVVTNPVVSSQTSAGQTVLASMEIKLGNSQHLLSNGATAAVTLSYPASVTDPTLLGIYVLDEASGLWVREFASTVNASSRTITGYTTHFSFFAVIGGAPAANLDTVRVYPVPWVPNDGDDNNGKAYRAGDVTSGILFDNIPADVQIRIYAMSGRLVAKFDTTASAGKLQWDGRNDDGREAASGGYFAVISSKGSRPVIRKIAIVR